MLLPENAVTDHLYDFLYAWHVPAFVFVTGYLSQRFAYTKVRMWQLVRTVVVPYLIFECALALFRVYVGGEQLTDLFQDPHWPMWYLSALFFWRLLTPVFRPMWAGVAVAVAVAVSLVAGLYAGDTLDIARVLGLLPFFVMGLKATPERLERLRGRPAQIAAVAVFVGDLGHDHVDRRVGQHRVALLPLPLRRDGLRRRPPRPADPGARPGDRHARRLGVPGAGAARSMGGSPGWAPSRSSSTSSTGSP